MAGGEGEFEDSEEGAELGLLVNVLGAFMNGEDVRSSTMTSIDARIIIQAMDLQVGLPPSGHAYLHCLLTIRNRAARSANAPTTTAWIISPRHRISIPCAMPLPFWFSCSGFEVDVLERIRTRPKSWMQKATTSNRTKNGARKRAGTQRERKPRCMSGVTQYIMRPKAM